jgi:hypothetical protein
MDKKREKSHFIRILGVTNSANFQVISCIARPDIELLDYWKLHDAHFVQIISLEMYSCPLVIGKEFHD